MRRFYVSFLGLLLLASVASMELFSAGASLRGGSDGWAEITAAAVSFVVLAIASLLLLYMLLALPAHGGGRARSGGGEQ